MKPLVSFEPLALQMDLQVIDGINNTQTKVVLQTNITERSVVLCFLEACNVAFSVHRKMIKQWTFEQVSSQKQ